MQNAEWKIKINSLNLRIQSILHIELYIRHCTFGIFHFLGFMFWVYHRLLISDCLLPTAGFQP